MKNIITIIGLVIISGFTGYSVGNKYINLNNYIEKSDYMNLANKMKTLEKNYQFALENLNRYKKAYNIVVPQIPNEVFLINGVVKKINASKIIINTPNIEINTLIGEKAELDDKTIIINKNTKLIKINPLKINLNNNNISINSIKIGDKITVSSQENIKSKKEFIASKISIIEQIEIKN